MIECYQNLLVVGDLKDFKSICFMPEAPVFVAWCKNCQDHLMDGFKNIKSFDGWFKNSHNHLVNGLKIVRTILWMVLKLSKPFCG